MDLFDRERAPMSFALAVVIACAFGDVVTVEEKGRVAWNAAAVVLISSVALFSCRRDSPTSPSQPWFYTAIEHAR